MIYIFKTHPFNMTFEEIREMTFRQAKILLEEFGKERLEKGSRIKKIVEAAGKNVFPVFDITTGV